MLTKEDLYRIEHDVLARELREWHKDDDITDDNEKYGVISGVVQFVEAALSYIDVIQKESSH